MNLELFLRTAEPCAHKITGNPESLWDAVQRGGDVVVATSHDWSPPDGEQAQQLFEGEMQVLWQLRASNRLAEWIADERVLSISPDNWPECKPLQERREVDEVDQNEKE